MIINRLRAMKQTQVNSFLPLFTPPSITKSIRRVFTRGPVVSLNHCRRKKEGVANSTPLVVASALNVTAFETIHRGSGQHARPLPS